MKASIVVVTFNNLHLTRQCLESIYSKTKECEFEVIVVDNASHDGTPDFLNRFARLQPNLHLILNSTNEGFARANNAGAAEATGDYIVFVNNDTVVTPGWLSGLERYLIDPSVGMVGPVTNSSGNESCIEVEYQTLEEMEVFAAQYTNSHRGEAFEIGMLPFFCVALRLAVYDEVGGLDERFGIGMFEDDDYALRVTQKGYRLLCVEDVFVHHFGSASFSLMPQTEYLTLFKENQRKFEQKWGLEWRPHQLRAPLVRKQIRQLLDTTIERSLQVAKLQQELQEARNQLSAITASTGWSLLQVLWRLRLRVIPRSSQREILARKMLRESRVLLRSVLSRKVRRNSSFNSVPSPKSEAPGERFPGLVSIVLPVFNQASLLRASIASVLAQSYTDLELLIVDDGSTDGVRPVLDEFAFHPKVRILTQPNQTLPKALSNGFEFARGEFWTWTSADNLMEPEQLAKQVSFLRSHPEATMVYADYLAIDDQGQPLGDPTFRPQNRRSPVSPGIHLPHTTEMLNRIPDNFIGPCFMYRGWAGRLLGEYAPEFGCEDYDYWMRMNRLFKIMHIQTDELLYQYRVHQNTLNAHAKELGIPERLEKLMAYERERSVFYDTPWTIYVDQWAWSWIRQIRTGPKVKIKRLKRRLPGETLGKVMFLVQASNLPIFAGQTLPSNSCLVAWYDAESSTPYLQRQELEQSVDLCFTSDGQTLERLSVFHPRAFQIAPGADLLNLALAWGNNHLSYKAHYTAEVRHRELPDAFAPMEHPIRVLIQMNDFGQGGLEQVVIDLVDVLNRENFQVYMLILGKQEFAFSRLVHEGVTVLTLPQHEREKSYRELLVNMRIDLINAHFSLFGAEIAASLNIPFVQTIHNSYVWLTPEQIGAWQACDRHTAAYICVSPSVALYSDVRLGLSPAKMAIIPNGINLERFRNFSPIAERLRLREELGLLPDDFVFLNVASIRPPKAQALVTTALARILSSCPNAKVVFAGKIVDQSYVEEMSKAIEAAGIRHAVILAGYQEEIVPFYFMADAFILPSLWEGWSLSLAEALYANLPIIATDVGAARELSTESGYQLIQLPFTKATDLDLSTMWHYIKQVHADCVDELAAAMQKAYKDRTKPVLSCASHTLDHTWAYQKHVRLFRWLIQAGDPTTARVWLRDPLRS